MVGASCQRGHAPRPRREPSVLACTLEDGLTRDGVRAFSPVFMEEERWGMGPPWAMRWNEGTEAKGSIWKGGWSSFR